MTSASEYFRGAERGAVFLDRYEPSVAHPHHESVKALGTPVAPAGAPARDNPQPGGGNAPAGDSGGWPEPQPLTARIGPEPYPLDALPGTVRAAVQEVQGFVQAPLPLVAASALGALSLACQAHIDIQRTERLQGPSGLFLLSIVDSGERKSTCDGFFTSAIREHQSGQAEAMKPVVREHQSALSAWEAVRDGMLAAIKETSKKGGDTEGLRADLMRHEVVRPEAPRVQRLILGDETPESLSWSLAKLWPSSGVLSSEAGTVLGSHAMSRDSIMRNLGLLNTLWDVAFHWPRDE